MWACIEHSRAALYPWLPWVPFVTDADTAYRFADTSAIDWDHGRAVRFAIRENATHAMLGVVGLESVQHAHKNADLGYWLRSDCARRGYMSEAGAMLLRWAFARLAIHRVRVAAATSNHASLGVIRNLGFRYEGLARQAEFCADRWLDHAIFSMLETDRIDPAK
jgi:RimJ/RimL family protein N-acetyltransferase